MNEQCVYNTLSKFIFQIQWLTVWDNGFKKTLAAVSMCYKILSCILEVWQLL